MARLTKAQQRFLQDCMRFSSGIPPEILVGSESAMAARLQALGLVELSNAHPVTGRMHQCYLATDAGRAALADGGDQ